MLVKVVVWFGDPQLYAPMACNSCPVTKARRLNITLLTQAELEKEMVDGGRARMAAMMQRNEDKESATNNPYASAVFRRFVLPMAAIIEADMAATGAGKHRTAAKMLQGIEATAVAYLSVRHVLNVLMQEKEAQARRVTLVVGKAIYNELILSVFENIEPKLFYTITNDLSRKMSKSERYRITVFKDQAKKAGIVFPEWGIAGATRVGAYLVDVLEQLGAVQTQRVRKATLNSYSGGGGKRTYRDELQISLDDGCLELIGSIKDFMIESCPVYLPCVEKPLDWIGVGDGGWHTAGMKRAQPFAIKTEGSWSELAEYDLSGPLNAINALQSVRWSVNRQMLLAIKEIAQHYDTEEIVGYAEQPKPDKPYWLSEDMKKEQMSPDEQDEFKAWRRATAEWFTEQKIRGTKYGRFSQALRVADKFENYPELYFVYFADFRGRLYVQTTGISPQGSDMQKSLLKFAEGKPLKTPEAVRWFKVNGANKFGFDKASLDDRAAWVDERRDLLLRIASDPINTKEDWTAADSPLQFLAWCFEYKRWIDEPSTFKSYLPVGMDGSCNGLQNFSAMLRDEVGGKATNLLPGLRPNDIYQMVADVASQMLRNEPEKDVPDSDGSEEGDKARRYFQNENRFRKLWLLHGLSRGLVKRSVMTKPYGSTRFSCADFIVGDYLKAGKAPEFSKEDYHPAARYLSRFVWRAISEVVVKADEAMNWLQQSSSLILKNENHIRWVTPDGFAVIQRYQKRAVKQIETKLCGGARLVIGSDTDTPDKNGHKNGVAPNFVHSLDATHMRAVAAKARREGIISMAMIHDDFGTHSADAQRFYEIIRETFVELYEKSNPLTDFAERHSLPAPPKPGKLNLRLVLQSPYFFS